MRLLRQLRNLWDWWHFPRRHHIPIDAVVLDVGCGNWPNMRANILADKFLFDNSERGYPLVLDNRPLIICDALRLPFKEKSVDYIVCSNLAEHLEEPEILFAELSRVGKAGYIECPSRLREMLHGWEFHRWYVQVSNGQIVLEEKPRPLHDPELHAWFSHLFESDSAFEQFFLENLERLGLVAGYDWVDRICYNIRRDPQANWKRTTARLETASPLTCDELEAQLERMPRPHPTRNERIKNWLSLLARRGSDARAAKQLSSMLCCPICQGDLASGSGHLVCIECEAQFPVVRNLYYLLPEQASQAHLTA